jgi:hypothetical protein
VILLRAKMGKVRKAFVVAFGGVAATYWVLFGWVVYASPPTYAEMGINHDREIMFFEINYEFS